MHGLNKIALVLETGESEFSQDCLTVKLKQRKLGAVSRPLLERGGGGGHPGM